MGDGGKDLLGNRLYYGSNVCSHTSFWWQIHFVLLLLTIICCPDLPTSPPRKVISASDKVFATTHPSSEGISLPQSEAWTCIYHVFWRPVIISALVWYWPLSGGSYIFTLWEGERALWTYPFLKAVISAVTCCLRVQNSSNRTFPL